MKIIVLMGMAGSGKSTVGKLVAEQLGWQYLSTGDIARECISGAWQEFGLPAPENEMKMAFNTIMKLLSNDGSNVVLDGLPRKVEQIEYLKQWTDVPLYYTIQVDTGTAADRLIERGRTDDTKIAIMNRLASFKTNHKKIIEAIRYPVTVIDGVTRTPEQIADIISHRAQ